jgi:DNA replicative helicase MCM subunit Mcm2 (Cdc46/Mcm family)
MLRMAQAHARVMFKDTVDQDDFMEALRLMECSKDSVVKHTALGKMQQQDRDLHQETSRDYKGEIKALLTALLFLSPYLRGDPERV